ncbi:MAG: hypothetical protein KKC51_13890 [Verrucomicrobia bacterium]|nr:hypothetical protein [Verrucomicrobiota bacterium]
MRIRILHIVLFAAAIAYADAFAVTTNLYHTNRVFRPIVFTNLGVTITAYQALTAAGQLTEVVGPTNIVINTNETRAIEYDVVGLGYDTANDAWESAVAAYQSCPSNHPGIIFDNVGWVKGTHQAYGDWGAFFWLMQNHVDFKTSITNIWISPNNRTNYITKVLVGSIGDYAPMENVVDVGPTNWADVTNFLGAGVSEDKVYKGDYRAFYELALGSIQKVAFTSDHGVLTDYNTDYAGSGGTVYNPRGWIKGGKNNPITHVKDSKITVDVTLCVKPAGLYYDLTGDGPIGALDFHKSGLTSSGSNQTFTITSEEKLPAQIDVLDDSISWSIDLSGGLTCRKENSGPHKIYVTWGQPGSGPTVKRVNKVCYTAWWQNTCEGIADSLQDMIAAETAFGPGNVDGWALLDGGSGDCDNQARCMKYTFEMLGAGAADVRLVRASSNAGQGNCLDLETRVVSNQTHYLIMDFDPSPTNYYWNAYEGSCEAANHYYAITPKKKEANDYEMLKTLGCIQYWVRTDVPPGTPPSWNVIEVFEEVPVP